MRYPGLNEILFAIRRVQWRRVVSFVLAMLLFATSAPFPAFSVESGEQGSASEESTPNSGELIYDYDTLKITRKGEQISRLDLLSHEKIEIEADGLTEDADFQWQVQHPEKDDVWVNIYDGTNQTISVTLALVENVLRADGTARIRCRAYTEDYAYLSNPVTVTLLTEGTAEEPAMYAKARSNDGIMLADDEPAPEFVTITIEYVQYDFKRDAYGDLVYQDGQLVYDEGKQAFTSYMATIHGGTDLNTTVHFPTMVGYDSYIVLNGVEQKATSYTIDLTGVTKDVVYTVKYLPAEVDYVVRYYFQNVYDDLYVENTSMKVSARGYTGAVPPDSIMNKIVPGFTSLYYQPDAIAADGSTVFEVYYERNYYLMEFDCDGGYGAETLYVRYGSYISVPQPLRSGYVFKGWDLVRNEHPTDPVNSGDGAVDVLPTAMPAYSSAYKAVWETADTTYTVVYWIEHSDGTKTYIADRPVEEVSATVVSGTDDLDTAYVCGEIQHIHGGTCSYSCGKTEHIHNVPASECCSLEEHTHSEEQGCYGNCTHTTHNQLSCYTNQNCTIADNLTNNNQKQAYNGLKNSVSAPVEGYVYRYNRSGTRYNFFYIGGTWYYLGTNNTYKGISVGNIGNPTNGNYTSAQATVNCSHPHTDDCLSCTKVRHTHGAGCNTSNCSYGGEHTHDSNCDFTCGLKEHTHSGVCKATTSPYLEFVRADEDVTVEGDGSTVVNVYYKYKLFEIRFIYARSYVDGRNTIYQVADTTNAGVVGGWGLQQVPTLPTVVEGSGFTGKQEVIRQNNVDYTYYYISLRAEYGANIEELWPGNAINDVTDSNGRVRRFGSWASEDGTPYRADDAEHANIVGPYPYMSSDMIKISNIEDEDGNPIIYTDPENGEEYYVAQRMSAWWGTRDEGNFGGWYHGPIDEHSYHIYYESLDGTGDRYFNGKWYNLVATHTFNCAHNGSTRVDPFYYTGYVCINNTNAEGYDGVDYQENSQNYVKGSTQRDENGNLLYNCPDGSCGYCNCFYYDGTQPTLSFVNYNSQSTTPPSLTLKYSQPLKEYNPGNPAYPSGIEPGAYVFEGWYTTPECYNGTEVKWDTLTMPDGNLTLYAKWTPILRNVTFYTDYADIPTSTNPGGTPFLVATGVPHGSLLGTSYHEIPDKGDEYDFVGWFYMDEDNKKRFAPDSMEITRDLVLFAEWQTSIDTTYEVEYVLRDDVSAENVPSKTPYNAGDKVGDTIFDHSSVGKTKTFSAKGLGELYPDFQKKFFPTVNTHSILMEPDGSLNTYTFEYVYDDTVYYKVRYVDYATRTEIAQSVVRSTDEAIVTEKFLPIVNYLPQSYYIRKALAYDGNATEDSVIDENVITFYYVKDTEHGLYSIEYYLENADSTDPNNTANYYQYESIVGSDDIGQTIKADIRPYEGFTHVPSLNTVITYKADGSEDTETVGGGLSGTVSYTGLTIKVYYQRNKYPYAIEYREYGAAADAPALIVKADGNGTSILGDEAKYDSVLTHTAEASFEKDGQLYEYYIDNPTAEQLTKSTTIRESATGAENKLVFYYKKHEVTVIYTPVCTVPGVDDFGVVSLYSERAATASGLSGSNASAGYGFKFVGWYIDEACTQPVDPSWRYTPGTSGSPDSPNANGTKLKPGTLDTKEDEVRYYALFEPVLSGMTIHKTVDRTTDDNFLFRIQGTGKTAYIDLIVSINGNGSVTLTDLPVGDYIVTELTNWSWEYDLSGEASRNVSVDADASALIAFTNTYVEQDWLGSETSNENTFTGVATNP